MYTYKTAKICYWSRFACRRGDRKTKLRYREEHSTSIMLRWCTLWHFPGKICWWLINHFYVIGHKS